MTALTRSVRGSANQLLYHVLEQPQLLAAVRELPAPVLVRLINHVGLEDAGELIALTSTQQLGQVFDAELWQSAEPGADETFRPERFALFLRLLYEAGEAFVVERLLAMPRQLLTLAFHKLLLVIDIDALTVRFESSGRFYDDSIDRAVRAIENAHFEEWEEFRLIARDSLAFEDVWNALLALDREDHELVRDVIERCCDMDGELIEESGLYAVLNEEEVLESDIAGERSDRRAAAGFVAPADARAFLELARRETIDEAPDGRDPITRAYFRELAPEEPTVQTTRALPTSHKADVGRLLSVLREANVLDDEPSTSGAPHMLGGAKPTNESRTLPKPKGAAKTRAKPARNAAKAKVPSRANLAQSPQADEAEGAPKKLTLMAAAMLVLREQNAALHAQRTEELGFLANVLVAGSRHDGRRYRPVEAIECALAVCSVALERRARSSAPPEAAKLLLELSADRLFRAGIHQLATALGNRARAHIAELLGIKVADVPAAMSGGSAALIPQVNLEAPNAVALAALAEPEPWLSGALTTDHLFIANQKDLKKALNFLANHEQDTTPDV